LEVEIALDTNAVVASCVVLVPAVAVGAAGVPVKVGDARGAYPLIEAPAGIVTEPVNVGDASGARVVSVAAVPVIDIPHVPLAPVPVNVGE
jgi:hypothetical protein